MNDIERYEIEQNDHGDRLMVKSLVCDRLTFCQVSELEFVVDNIKIIHHYYSQLTNLDHKNYKKKNKNEENLLIKPDIHNLVRIDLLH